MVTRIYSGKARINECGAKGWRVQARGLHTYSGDVWKRTSSMGDVSLNRPENPMTLQDKVRKMGSAPSSVLVQRELDNRATGVK